MCVKSFPSCPNSQLAYFPEEIYRYVGSSVVLPQLVEAVDQVKLVAVQIFPQKHRTMMSPVSFVLLVKSFLLSVD